MTDQDKLNFKERYRNFKEYYDNNPVALDDYDKSHNRITNQYGLEYVCQNGLDSSYDEDMFVMGIKGSYQNHNGKITQDDDYWKIFKVKSYDKIVDGETWGVVRAVLE